MNIMIIEYHMIYFLPNLTINFNVPYFILIIDYYQINSIENFKLSKVSMLPKNLISST